ncbi:hypothetical protein QCA50_006378 [Cerrena zonata]|uniref:Endonuclease/exonuclease/phosphatase domain-containing protein n=1 Tax=Cerrena zonata TaxID=2478898 RepID=A0AAW0GJ06_9APHY
MQDPVRRINKNTKAHLAIASLNMRGAGTNAPLHPNNKWSAINFMLKDKRLGVLALQEMHLTEQLTANLHNLYGKRMQIFQSANPTAPTQRAGVAIVINKELANVKGATSSEIVPAVYALNDPSKNRCFWEGITQRWDELNLAPPDVVLGDFNLVDEAIDRLPAHADDPDAVAELADIKNHFGVIDGWQSTFPETRDYSFIQEATGSHSRID